MTTHPASPASEAATLARYIAPGRFTQRVFNPFVAWLARRGLSVRGSAELTVRGRVSGQPRTVPVNPLTIDGHRYLVAPRGNTEWVRNLRVATTGELRVGRRRETFAATEVADSVKPEILRAYLRVWKAEVGIFFDGIGADATDAQLLAIAPGYPVFAIVPAIAGKA